MRTLRTVALRLLTIVFASLETTFVALLDSFLAVVEDVLAIAEAIRRPGVVTKPVVAPWVPVVPPTKRTVDAIGVRTNDYHSSTAALCLSISRRSKRDTKHHERTEKDAADPSHVLSFHSTSLNCT